MIIWTLVYIVAYIYLPGIIPVIIIAHIVHIWDNKKRVNGGLTKGDQIKQDILDNNLLIKTVRKFKND